MTRTLGSLAAALLPAMLLAQEPPPAPPPEDPALVEQRQAVERLFEAGRHQEVIAAAAAPDIQPAVVYMAAQSQLKLSATSQAAQAQAIQTYQRLEARPTDDPWHFIGLSGRQLVQNQIEPAIASAREAIARAPMFGPAHYQLGLSLARAQRWPEAAAAFEAAAMRRPGHAYTHYYAGLSYYRAGRPDQMSVHFDQFLKLAPEAPERPEVQSIMRTIRR